jgi:hypothetical protein
MAPARDDHYSRPGSEGASQSLRDGASQRAAEGAGQHTGEAQGQCAGQGRRFRPTGSKPALAREVTPVRIKGRHAVTA